MSIFRHSQSRGIEASRSRLIIGLLILILFLVLGLAWQANRTMRTNSATAKNVLQDYARLVADEYSRRAMGEVGYYGYYVYINMLRRRALEDADFPFQVTKLDADSPEGRASQLASYLFFVDMENADIQFSGSPEKSPGVEEFLYDRADTLLQGPMPESGFKIEHVTLRGQPHTFVISKVNETRRIFGFEVHRSELTSWLRRAFKKDVLLPKSLAGGAITNESIYLRFADDNDNVLFEAMHDYDPNLLVSKLIGNEYDGIFERYKLSAAIDPEIAGLLVIGGLPRSRLPVLLAVIILTVGLLIAAIRQLQREHALMQLRTGFVSEVSHELRTPLTQIRMFTETLLFERFKTTDDKRRALEIINRESQRLIHLVENVLRFSDRQGDRRELHFASKVLGPLIESVVNEFQPLAEAAGATVEVKLDPGVSVPIDDDALRQVLLNLLDNAIKYGPTGQRAKVALTGNPDCARISVSDQGPGIPPIERERIWGGYYRLDRERRSAIAGTGIGLAVVRELVGRHGGKTWVEDSGDGGARFVVEFPKSAQHETRASKQDMTPTNLSAEKLK